MALIGDGCVQTKSAKIWTSLDDSTYISVTGERGRLSNGGWKDQSPVERSAMAEPVRASRLRSLANSNAENQDSQSPLAVLDPEPRMTSSTCAKAMSLLVKAC